MTYTIFNKCDEIISDYCFENNINRKVIAKEIGISSKQFSNVLSGDVDSCFDILVTVFIKYIGESALPDVFEELFTMIKENEAYITSKNLFTLYELSIILGKKSLFIVDYLGEISENVKLTKAIKQTIQVILIIERIFTYDNIKGLNLQPLSINADYAEMFYPPENMQVELEYKTFLDFCINMRRNERIAIHYYEHGEFAKAADIYAMLYELPTGKHHGRYLGYKLLQSLSQSENDETFELMLSRVLWIDQEPFGPYLENYIENEYYKTDKMPELLKFWFIRDKEQLIRCFEQSDNIKDMFTIKLLLSNLTKSCSYIL